MFDKVNGTGRRLMNFWVWNNEEKVEDKMIAVERAVLKIRDEQIFYRFKKEQQSSDSLGEGLSIVKKICDLYNFQIQYAYQVDYHSFKVIL